jgi:hypothetical protein
LVCNPSFEVIFGKSGVGMKSLMLVLSAVLLMVLSRRFWFNKFRFQGVQEGTKRIKITSRWKEKYRFESVDMKQLKNDDLEVVSIKLFMQKQESQFRNGKLINHNSIIFVNFFQNMSHHSSPFQFHLSATCLQNPTCSIT